MVLDFKDTIKPKIPGLLQVAKKYILLILNAKCNISNCQVQNVYY